MMGAREQRRQARQLAMAIVESTDSKRVLVDPHP